MLGTTYEGQNCSAARTLEFVGERWSLLIIRDALFRNITRFSDFQRGLGVASNILAKRLDGFVAAGLMKRAVGDDEAHEEYFLTNKGQDLAPVIVALTEWGDRWAAKNGPPIVFIHDCGTGVKQALQCAKCGTVDSRKVSAKRGPGAGTA